MSDRAPSQDHYYFLYMTKIRKCTEYFNFVVYDDPNTAHLIWWRFSKVQYLYFLSQVSPNQQYVYAYLYVVFFVYFKLIWWSQCHFVVNSCCCLSINIFYWIVLNENICFSTPTIVVFWCDDWKVSDIFDMCCYLPICFVVCKIKTSWAPSQYKDRLSQV